MESHQWKAALVGRLLCGWENQCLLFHLLFTSLQPNYQDCVSPFFDYLGEIYLENKDNSIIFSCLVDKKLSELVTD